MPLSKARQAQYMKDYRKRTVIPKQSIVIPKYPLGIQYPDGRMRTPEGKTVIPKECREWKPYSKTNQVKHT